jgi:ribosomal protein L40E
MAFLDRLNKMANVATEKASGAIEVGKLNLKVNTEEKKIEESTIKIGEALLLSLDAGQAYDEAIMQHYEDIKTARAAITSIKAEIANISGSLICPSCAAKNPPESKFCRECGTKLETEAPAEEPVEIVEILCSNCGASVASEEKFCTNCGAKLD